MKRSLVIGIPVVLALLGALVVYGFGQPQEKLTYTVGQVSRGNVESVVVTTGTLQALNTVVVGSQLSGQIDELLADFNDTVEAGQLLARIDPRTFQSRVEQNSADVSVAEASIMQREAEVVLWQATLAQAGRERERRASLKERGHVSASELDVDFTAVETATAQLKMSEAAVQNAKALARQRRAALSQSELDLERTFIRSPISGTVINRTIEIGQTVAASLQAPELFQIAQDLHDMKVEASVDEADIGRIAEGMDARFSVDAFPERHFNGKVQQIRRAPDTVQNVVTYRVIITASNTDLALLPGMTANVEIVLGSRSDVLTLPNAATRFVPKGASIIAGVGGPGGRAGGPGAMLEQMKSKLVLTADQVAAAEALMSDMQEKMGRLHKNPDPSAVREGAGKIFQNMSGRLRELLNEEQQRAFDEMASDRSRSRDGKPATVWVLRNGEPVAHPIRTGLADDNTTELIDGLDEGATVILRASRAGG